MKNFFTLVITSSLFAALLVSGCSSTRQDKAPQKFVVTQASLDSNLLVIENLEPNLDELDAEFRAFPNPAKEGLDFYNAEEIDAMEGLLFRLHASQTSLWDIVDGYGGLDEQFPEDITDTKAQVLALQATLLIASHTAFVVEHFADNPLAIKLMNQSYYRSEIPFGSYDRMRVSMTAEGLRDAVVDAQTVYTAGLHDPASPLTQLASTDAEYAAIINQLPILHAEAAQRLQQVASHFPSNSAEQKVERKDEKGQHKRLYALRAFLFKTVSRLKNPRVHVLEFSDAQKEQIFSLLEPGDLVLTQTAGYMSDVFIPGAFKHGITYIGEQNERILLDLSVDNLPPGDRYQPEKLTANLQKNTLANGTSIDMIESVAEGVIFNNLEHIMDTHINRMLVLRPRLTDAERADFIVEVYSYLGDGYDFRFDFADASQQVCTEVIYRAINGKGDINFILTMRAGHETLSADDIANYHLETTDEAFDFVLLVEPDPKGKKNAAAVYTGAEGETKLQALMKEAGSKK